MEIVKNWFFGISEFISSLNIWIKIGICAAIAIIALIIVLSILKKRRKKRIAEEKLKRMRMLDTAISNDTKENKR